MYTLKGVASMIRIFGSDIMHTWTLGFIEACVGFTLQIVKYIGMKNVDSEYSLSAKKLVEIIKNFPAHNSLHPVRHTRFADIFELYQSMNSKNAGNPLNTTNILKMREGFKLASATEQLYFALADNDILPSDLNWAKKRGFEEPYFSPRQVLINALNSVLEVHWHLTCGALTETQLQTLQMLIANAQAHMLVLDVVRKRIITKAIVSKDLYEDLHVDKINLMSTIKFELLTHFVEAMRESGCDNNVRDTQMGELLMKSCKILFGDTNKRYHSVLKDMLSKYLHLQYMFIAQKGLECADLINNAVANAKKDHNRNSIVCRVAGKEYRSNNMYTKQLIVWSRKNGCGQYVPAKDGSNWSVHPMLKMV